MVPDEGVRDLSSLTESRYRQGHSSFRYFRPKENPVQVTPAAIRELVPFARTLDVEFPELTPDLVVARLVNRPDLSTLGGGLHGGAIMGLADLAGAVCAALNIGDDDTWTTVESTTYFLRPVHAAAVTARATPTRTGRSLVFVQIDIHTAETHAARTTQILAVHPRRG
ncbi:PaaI family thioesterase [Nocardia takedensis]